MAVGKKNINLRDNNDSRFHHAGTKLEQIREGCVVIMRIQGIVK